jgi:crossover junction endodeoxyribonuclease RuvC
MRVLGIDPGYERLGIAILEKDSKKETLVYSGCFQTTKDIDFNKRLFLISTEVSRIISEFKPNTLAIENLFFNKNQKTVMRVSEVRGAIINLCLSKGLGVREFTPLQIKVAVTGYGRSDKKQVIDMVKNLIKIEERVRTDDEFDAIAIGLTFFATKSHLDAQNSVF